MFNIPLGQLLIASIIAGIIGLGGLFIVPLTSTESVDMRIEPPLGAAVIGETFTIAIIVNAEEPVNVFQGEVSFDPTVLEVDAIDYNTSIADLWAERPWFSNGAGTLNFIGGTTKSGGFTGEGSLIAITFKTKMTGETKITMTEAKILRHDSKGNEVPLPSPIDSLLAVSPEQLQTETKLEKTVEGPLITVLPEALNIDLNADGKQSVADASIFMTHLASQNLRSDFNQDGKVDLKDLSILTR